MKPYSVTRRLTAAVLLLELLSALALTWLAVAYEGHTRLRTFDLSLRARADTLFGAVGDADDPADTVVLDTHDLRLPQDDLFRVESAGGALLGSSPNWPAQAVTSQLPAGTPDGIYPVTLNHHAYHFVLLHAVRVIDPGDPGGGVKRLVIIRYGASTDHVWGQVWQAVRFYALASLILLTASGFAMAWFLRRSLAPISELADEASKISAQHWRFHPQQAARVIRELAPLTIALESALARLEVAFAQQKRFTRDAAHELKTDLATAKSSLQLLAMRRRSPEEYERGLEVCLTDTLRIEQTVSEMLTLARVEHTGTITYIDPADRPGSELGASLAAGMQQFESMARLREVALHCDCAGDTRVPVSEQDARILCANLLLNALQHSRPGTEVRATLRALEGWVTLTIADQGEGISPDALPHIFEPFFRGDASRDRRRAGTGLGLAICQGICRHTGGDISIRSQSNQGTEVCVRLPLAGANSVPVSSSRTIHT